MRTPRIVIAESAVADLEAIVAWYVEQGVPDVGRRLVAEVIQRVETLSENPEIGRVVPEFNLPQLRELIHPPFRIVYRYVSGSASAEVQIVRVWRSERLLRLEHPEDIGN